MSPRRGAPFVLINCAAISEPLLEAEMFGNEAQNKPGQIEYAEGGTAFERRVWTELLTIPYGETASYGEIAARIGHRGKARAVGRANGRNPVAIVCPCHRVIGSDGSLTGFGGGLENKRTLLDLEAGALTLAMDTA